MRRCGRGAERHERGAGRYARVPRVNRRPRYQKILSSQLAQLKANRRPLAASQIDGPPSARDGGNRASGSSNQTMRGRYAMKQKQQGAIRTLMMLIRSTLLPNSGEEGYGDGVLIANMTICLSGGAMR